MRYIRTKDGRIIDLKRYKNETSPISKARGFITLIDKLKICDLEIFEKDIIKQADTIEELCDEFVAMHKSWKATYVIQKILFKQTNESFNVYGAIWTTKGLIYVAKMNEEGELELL